NRFLHRTELDRNLKRIVQEGRPDLDRRNLHLFFEEASEDVNRQLSKEGFLQELKSSSSNDVEVESVVQGYFLECLECEREIEGVPDKSIMVTKPEETGRLQKNISSVKLAGLTRAFTDRELCFACLVDEVGQGETPIKLLI
ncbi:MAG: hypothetical protein SV377_01785, partial [Halobacteria archaeon]|nr:hypothetical protein [Halobacteria archaeon]